MRKSNAATLSSSTKNSGDRAKARASTMRCRCPPLKLPGLRAASDALSPTSSSNPATEGPCLSARASTASCNAAPTVMLGLRAEKGSWNTGCAARLNSAPLGAPPFHVTSPSSHVSRPRRMLPRVDLPDPLSPTRPTRSPGAMAKSTPLSASKVCVGLPHTLVRATNRFTTRRAATRGASPAGPAAGFVCA